MGALVSLELSTLLQIVVYKFFNEHFCRGKEVFIAMVPRKLFIR